MDTESIFTRMLRSVCSWIVKRAGGGAQPATVLTPLITQPGGPPESAVPVFDLTSHVLTDDGVVRSDGSSGEALQASRYDHALWRVGWTDGRLGVDPASQTSLISAQAELTRQTRLAGVRAEFEKAKAAENLRRTEYRSLEDDWEQAKAEHDAVVKQQRRDPAGFSRILGCIYVIAAVAIVVADVPLSLLVAAGLGIDVSSASGGGNPMDLDNLITNFTSTWGAICVAVGVAALTISFKLLIDRFYVRDEDDEERFMARFRAVIRIFALVAAAGATISAFLVMGRVRAIMMNKASAVPFSDIRYLFSVLAILFPVVAAFCLSMSRLCWQNAGRLALAAKRLKQAWQKYRTSQQPFEAAQAERMAVEQRLMAIVANSDVDETFLRELYTHAFDRGWAVPETRMPAASLYDRCEHLIHRALGRIEQYDNA